MQLHDLDLTPIKELSDELMQDEELSIADKKEMLWNYVQRLNVKLFSQNVVGSDDFRIVADCIEHIQNNIKQLTIWETA